MTQPVSNVRVRRTQKLLREALIELIEERSFEALTIGELTERAMVSRAASYRTIHTFSDEFVPDLVSTMFVEAITWWLEQGRSYTPREIATRSALLASAVFKEASTWQ